MKRLGLIGGMSWESTQVYYDALNRGVKARLGGLHSAELLLASVDFAPIAAAQASGEWDALAQQLSVLGRQLESAGAELLMICTNTMHKVAPEVSTAIDIPLLHIGDASGHALRSRRIEKVALLGTRFTMSEPFYREHLEQHFGVGVITPSVADQDSIHRIIFEELCVGTVSESSRLAISAIIDRTVARGAQAVLLGCTELGLLVPPQEAPLPILDTTLLHVDYALDAAL